MKRIGRPTEEMPVEYKEMEETDKTVKTVETSTEIPPKQIFNHNLKHLKSFKNIRTAYKNKHLKSTFVNDLSVVLKEYDPKDLSNELNDELLLEIMNISEEYFICKSKTTRDDLKYESVKTLMLPYFRNDEKLLDKTISHIYHKVNKSTVVKRIWKRFKFFFVRK